MAKTVIGIFQYRQDAESAIDELKDLNYDPKNISVIMKDIREAQRIHYKTGADVAGGATTGAATGGIIGGLTGILIGVGAITVPGLGALLIGGPIATALGLTGAAATATTGAITGALAGGLIGALTSLGIPKEEASRYEEHIRGGGILLAVPTRNARADEVRGIMEKYKATDIQQLDMPASPEQHHYTTA